MIVMLVMSICAKAHTVNHSQNVGTEKSPFFVKVLPPEGAEENDKKHAELALERENRQEIREINKAQNDESLTTATKWLAGFTFGLMVFKGSKGSASKYFLMKPEHCSMMSGYAALTRPTPVPMQPRFY